MILVLIGILFLLPVVSFGEEGMRVSRSQQTFLTSRGGPGSNDATCKGSLGEKKKLSDVDFRITKDTYLQFMKGKMEFRSKAD